MKSYCSAKFKQSLTWINIGGCHGNYRCSYGNVLINLHRVTWTFEDGRIIVEVQDIAVDGQSGREAGLPVILRLHHQNIMLYLQINLNELGLGFKSEIGGELTSS